jgi:hypothetical protein
VSNFPRDVLELRQRGHGGGRIPEHRAFVTAGGRYGVALGVILLALVLLGLILAALPTILLLWRELFRTVGPLVGLSGEVLTRSRHVAPFLTLDIPYVVDIAPLPTQRVWAATALGTLAIFVASVLMPTRWLPLAYLLRFITLVQTIALAYFGFFGRLFPYDLANYTYDMLTLGAAMIALIPVLYGLTYFVFDFTVSRKALLVVLSAAHLSVFVPLQYLTQAALIRQLGLLFMPVLFMVFGTLLDVAVLIAFYGWGMSWRDRTELKDASAPAVVAGAQPPKAGEAASKGV